MKKIFYLVCLMATMLLSACSGKSMEVEFYFPVMYYQEFKDPTLDPKEDYIGKNASGEKLDRYLEIYQGVLEEFGQQKEPPMFREATRKDLLELMGQQDTTAIISGVFEAPNRIYLLETEALDQQALAHEILHYLSYDPDNIGKRGMLYEKDGFEYGRFLNEGVTDYFARQLYPNVTDVYSYEAHVAEVLAAIYGEEALREVYFSSDVEPLRADFIKSLEGFYEDYVFEGNKFDPFDVFANSIGCYYMCMRIESPYLFDSRNSIDEMLLIYGAQKGVDMDRVMEIRKGFLKECPWFKEYTIYK